MRIEFSFEKMPMDHNTLPSSLELAYLGDTVYDLYVRTMLVRAGGRMKNLHGMAVKKVCAAAQAEAFLKVEPMLTEAEADVARRARNAKQSPPKNADPKLYHLATALEALIGYLYAMGEGGRIADLMEVIFPD